MRNLAYFILFAAFILTACSKGEKVCCAPPERQNYIEAKINDTTWIASAQTNYYKDSLFIWGSGGEEHVRLAIKYNGPGSYPLDARNGWFFVTVGQDMIASNYFTENSAGVINITGFDRDKRIIEGNFYADMVKFTSNNTGTNPIKLSMRQGKLRVQLPK